MIAKLPKGAKPSKCTSPDPTRPLLQTLNLRKTTKSGGWVIEATDAYKAVQVALDTDPAPDQPSLAEGAIGQHAMKVIETAKARAFAANGTVTPIAAKTSTPLSEEGPRFSRPTMRYPSGTKFPDVDRLFTDAMPAGAARVSLVFNARFLWELAQAMGSEQVELTLDTTKLIKQSDGVQSYLKPYLVTPANDRTTRTRGLLMPIRREP